MVNFVDDGTVYFAHKQPEVVSQKLSRHYDNIEKIYEYKQVSDKF